MFEFTGTISAEAEKHMWKQEKLLGVFILYIGITLLLPIIILISIGLKETIEFETWKVLLPYCSLYVIIPLVALMPKNKKEKEKYRTQMVFSDDEYIVAIQGNGKEECKHIADVKSCVDYGEFYQLLFPIGNISYSFICQKNLLTKGTLEEFESLFEGKIIRKTK